MNIQNNSRVILLALCLAFTWPAAGYPNEPENQDKEISKHLYSIDAEISILRGPVLDFIDKASQGGINWKPTTDSSVMSTAQECSIGPIAVKGGIQTGY